MNSFVSEYINSMILPQMFNVDAIGLIRLKGTDGLDLLNRLSTNLVLPLEEYSWCDTVLTSEKGRIIDLLRVYNFGEFIFLRTSKFREKIVIDWIEKYNFDEDVELELVTADFALLSIFQNPDSGGSIFGHSFESLEFCREFQITKNEFTGRYLPNILDLAGGDLLVKSTEINYWKEKLVNFDVQEMKIESFDLLRIMQKFPIWDKELNDKINPLEAGLESFINFEKGCYIGQEVIARLDTYDKLKKKLYLVEIIGEYLEFGTKLLVDDDYAGEITSCSSIEIHNKRFGLAYIYKKYLDVKEFLVPSLNTVVQIS